MTSAMKAAARRSIAKLRSDFKGRKFRKGKAMDKSGAQLTVETLLGEAKAGELHKTLMTGQAVQLPGHTKTKVWWTHPYFRTTLPEQFFLEARGGGQWADPDEFVWASLALLLMEDIRKISKGIRCLSFFGKESHLKQTPRLRKKVKVS